MRRPRHCILANHAAVPREVQGNSARFRDVTGPIVDGCETRLMAQALRSGVVWRWSDPWARQGSRRLCKTGYSDGTWPSASPGLLSLKKRAGRKRGLRSVLTATPRPATVATRAPLKPYFRYRRGCVFSKYVDIHLRGASAQSVSMREASNRILVTNTAQLYRRLLGSLAAWRAQSEGLGFAGPDIIQGLPFHYYSCIKHRRRGFVNMQYGFEDRVAGLANMGRGILSKL
ncbi:hypothetical protein CGRA01v4_13960 [Colletotrichum graminicola]|nr:hypothetical protein CGRA01v4_13960 [Colletotrichum graminicola]